MGAGKSTVGRRLAEKLGRPFYDSDTEIEKAAGLSISDIFALHGEADFRRGEQQVLKRLLAMPPHVLATGGGAYQRRRRPLRYGMRGRVSRPPARLAAACA